MPDRRYRLRRLIAVRLPAKSFPQMHGDHEINASRLRDYDELKIRSMLRIRPDEATRLAGHCGDLPFLRQIAQIIIAGAPMAPRSINQSLRARR